MKKIILIVLLLFIYFNGNSQKEKTTLSAPANLVGIKTIEDFKQQPYDLWFNPNYSDYKLDKSVVKELNKHIKGVSIKAFMGTWCGDSKLEVPGLYKLLDALKFEQKNLTMIAVNRDKKTPDNLQHGLNIFRVPTFIFYKNGQEIGRFVEYPRETLEKDILKIVSGKTYKHSYETD